MLRTFPWPEVLIIALAVVLRVVALDIKPAHFDEGVNGWFADRMTETGYYDYDPTNYHGPLHMYAVFVSQTLFGRNIWALRLPAIIASIACVWMALRFAPFVGRPTALWAALIMAVSPGLVFYGRYSIHESALVLFTMVTVWGIFSLWTTGRSAGIRAIGIGITGLILTKETYIIHLGCLALAFPCLMLWERFSPSRPKETLARQEWSWNELLAVAGLSVFAIVFFYSGTFLDWNGLHGLYQTFAAWFATGVAESGHEKSDYDRGPLNYYWLALMARYEFVPLLGLIACFRYLWPSSALLRYLAISGGGTLLAYTIIPYKTPWLIIAMLWPFCFTIAGVISEFSRFRWVPAVASACVVVLLVLSIRLNFVHFADPEEPYVYVQTFPEITIFTDPLLKAAKDDPAAYHMTGRIVLDSYYPLPWILGDFTGIGYYEVFDTMSLDDVDFIATGVERQATVEERLSEPYFRRTFRLRDGMDECVAYFRASRFSSILQGEPEFQPK